MPKTNLNQNFIDNKLACPPGKPSIEFNCNQLQGFHVRVTATSPGIGTYVQSYKDASGKRRHVKIGRTTDMTLKEARARGAQIRADVLAGGDPQSEAMALKATMTWDVFFTQRYYPYIQERKRSNRNDRDLHKNWISPALGGKRLDRITRHDVEKLHQAMFDQGRSASTCNHLIKIMRRAYNYAIENGLVKENPVTIKAFHEDNQRQRILSQEELQRLTAVLKSDDNRMVCNVVLLLLSTGLRANEALSSDWSSVDRNSRTLTVEARNSKSKRKRLVPLSDAAIRILDEVGTEGKSPHLFINTRTKEQLTTISKVWNRLRNEAGMPDLRLHDLRHTYASMLVNAGVSIYEIQQILGHADIKQTSRYSHVAPETQQKAASVASDLILAALDSAA